ncbi:Ldh family oxidoreductase [Roseitranquillus sediminis]|uniref:Ldh family oxidoreductase n=1 Tax=Roseitranquillus sediminis TaxID=2809051 RepID=UPI001D0C8CE8|nr:Ldh family oxidoreductase [Roseitranquillus sediminis]MBM9593865.1 Ldh family oxidoreductase [Roseitranquillus sediminis]
MRLSLGDARELVIRSMRVVGHDEHDAGVIADHLMDCELRGVDYGGLARALSVVERIRKRPEGRRPISVVRETPVSVMLDGGDQAGYLVGHRATRLGIGKAEAAGFAVAGVTNTWFTGMFAHYMEMATSRGLIAMAAGSSDWRVAPSGSAEGRFGTNPVAFGFPSDGDPIIMDTALSSVMVSEATLAARLDRKLDEGKAYGPDGQPTRDPTEALAGAFTVWGGHKGSALGVMIQLFGLLAGGAVRPDPLSDCSLFLMFMRPDLLVGEAELRRNVSAYADALRQAAPIDAARPPRMPFDRSAAERRARLADGHVEVADHVVERLRTIAAGGT